MVIIIGAGLSGLLTAYRLKRAGISFKLLEARDRIGGRINTVYGSNQAPVEMGATWFTDQHTHLIALLTELQIDFFEQHMDRTVYYQASANAPAQVVQIPHQAPSYRISGGTSRLIKTLYQSLDKKEVFLSQSVTAVKFDKDGLAVHAKDTFKGNRLVLALPPKLWAKNIKFEPSFPNELMTIAKQTHTWMEDSVKIALTYDQPFWEVENKPATLFSNSGPITEFYDQSNHESSKYALCGFMHSSFKDLSHEERRARVIDQITAIYGQKASAFNDYTECIWNREEYTFETSDVFLYPHQNNGNPIFSESYFDDSVWISSAEVASAFPGYMEGAVCSANAIATDIIKTRQA